MQIIMAFVIGLVFLPVISVFDKELLEKLSYVATVIASFAVVIAYIDFRRRKNMETALTVTDQLHFFRTEILPIANKIAIGEKFDDVSIRININIENLSYGALYKQHKDLILRQQDVCKSLKIEESVISLFNALEEFSWKVILNQTEDAPALRVVYESYVQFVETFTYRIGINRDYTESQFEGIARLYKKWSSLISRETVDERVDRVVKKLAMR